MRYIQVNIHEIIYCLGICMVSMVDTCSQTITAQSQNTKHTLRLNEVNNMPPASIQDAAWIAGHYQSEVFGGIGEEVWSPPLGGTMMGMFKVVKADSIIFYEFLIIEEESNSLVLKLKHFHPDLKGWEEKEEFVSFPLVQLSANAIYFDGLTFQKIDQDTLQVYLALTQHGETSEVDIKYHRIGPNRVAPGN